VTNLPLIIRRIEAALAKVAGHELRAIYLTEADHRLFDAAMRKRYGAKGASSFLAYGDIQIRRGKRSSVYTKQGLAVAVPKRPPEAMKEAA
jgi:hypothetical protein